MLNFDINKITVEHVLLKEITSKGHIHYYQYNNLKKVLVTKADKSLYVGLRAKKKPTSFLKPKSAFIFRYDGHPINVEYVLAEVYHYSNSQLIKRDKEEVEGLIKKWEEGQLEFKNKLIAILDKYKDSTFLFDGKYISVIDKEVLEKAANMSKDGCFKLTNSMSINIKELKETKRALIFYSAVNPKTNAVVNAFLPSFSKIDTKLKDLDTLNETYFVNLNFPIDASRFIGDIFGIGALEFLQIEDIMLQLKVLNIYSIDTTVRNVNYFSKDIIPCLSWIAKFCYKAENIDQLISIKQLLSKLLGVNHHLTNIKQLKSFENLTVLPEVMDVNNYKTDLKNNIFLQDTKKQEDKKITKEIEEFIENIA